MKEALGLSRYAPPSAVSALCDLGDTLRLRFLRLLRLFAANFLPSVVHPPASDLRSLRSLL